MYILDGYIIYVYIVESSKYIYIVIKENGDKIIIVLYNLTTDKVVYLKERRDYIDKNLRSKIELYLNI